MRFEQVPAIFRIKIEGGKEFGDDREQTLEFSDYGMFTLIAFNQVSHTKILSASTQVLWTSPSLAIPLA